MNRLLSFGFVAFALGAAASWAADATKLEDLSVMALGPLDGRAVVKTADGKMQVLKLGDTIPGTKAMITQVLTDKLVVEETVEKPGQPPVKQTVWISKPAKPGEKSVMKRFDNAAPQKDPVAVPVMKQIKQ